MKKSIILLTSGLYMTLAFGQNPIAEFYSNDNYPAWTDDVKWGNQINMQTYDFAAAGCTDCNTDFKKFEYARDVLYNNGGGALYYPEGDYYFNDITEWGDSPAGKGLMLKKGVVILGETPTASKQAVPWSEFSIDEQLIYKEHGLNNLKTRFHFPYKQVDQSKIVESKDEFLRGLIPYTWNFIGITKGANETGLKDVTNVGIAWVQLDGAYIFFGFDASWAPTWDQSNGWLVNSTKQAGINGWNSRVPDGTHTLDIWCGVSAPIGQGDGMIYPGDNRFVFGCRLDNACVSNYMFDGTWYKKDNVYQYGMGDNFLGGGSFRYASKIAIYGANVFIANNVIPISDKNFIFKSKMFDRTSNTITVDDNNLMFNYGYGHGIDVNKQLISRVYNRCDFEDGIQFKSNVVIKDNWVHNAAGKILDVAGSYMVLQHNVGYKYPCSYSGWSAYGFSNSFIIPFQYGATISKATDDFMNRFIDLGSNNTWIDNNWYTGTGSLANDGEGILIQKTPGEQAAFSLAITKNICGHTGQGKYMGVWDTKAFGYLAAQNRNGTFEGWVGVNKGGMSGSAYDNFLNDGGTRSAVKKVDDPLFAEWSLNEATVFAANNVKATWDMARKAFLVTWDDNSQGEMGYVVERSEKGQNTWTRIAYRPRQEGSSDVVDFDLGTANGKSCKVTGTLNPSNWYDYLTNATKEYEYRVGTVYTLETDQDVELFKYTNPAIGTVGIEKNNFNASNNNNIRIFPNPASSYITIAINEAQSFDYTITDLTGKILLSGKSNNNAKINVSNLSGLYFVQVSSAGKVLTQKIVIKK